MFWYLDFTTPRLQDSITLAFGPGIAVDLGQVQRDKQMVYRPIIVIEQGEDEFADNDHGNEKGKKDR